MQLFFTTTSDPRLHEADDGSQSAPAWVDLPQRTRTYFISDAHLGSRMVADPHGHEQRLVAWLDRVKADARAVYMVGDMFDFWFEYRTVVPKGFVRFLGKVAELADLGIEMHFFTGNHDIWTFGYLEHEVGMTVHRQAIPEKSSFFPTPIGDMGNSCIYYTRFPDEWQAREPLY